MTNNNEQMAGLTPRQQITKLVTDMTVDRSISEEYLIDYLLDYFTSSQADELRNLLRNVPMPKLSYEQVENRIAQLTNTKDAA